MGKDTDIQYADSTCNAAMGCDGCELWTGKQEAEHKVRRCYAGTLTELRKGHKGFPDEFTSPVMFIERIQQAVKWKDLTGTKRQDKSWIDYYPRIIFHGDMGDYWTESLDLYWLLPYVQQLEQSPHIHLFLTKRPLRMYQTFKAFGRVPENFWLGTSITGPENAARGVTLARIADTLDCITWISYEPNIGNVKFSKDVLKSISWMVIGGESDQEQPARPMDFEFLRKVIANCKHAGVATFIKQLGSVWSKVNYLYSKDRHGGDWNHWPKELRLRQLPLNRHIVDKMNLTRQEAIDLHDKLRDEYSNSEDIERMDYLLNWIGWLEMRVCFDAGRNLR